MLQAIHHVAIIAADYERSKRFYTEILGLELVREVYRAERDSWKLDLAVNGTYQIELFSFPNPPARPSHPEACGLRHLAFSVKNLEEVIEIVAAKGVETEPIRTDEWTGRRFTFLADPDGLPVELYEIDAV
ncbi:MAG: VOC family protein [Sphingobacteriaceae bacterium]|nr:VOC family protein [Cytophagaceae bacterium]